MSIHVLNLALDFLFGGLALYRIHRGDLLESGTMLRLGIFMLAVWRGFGDVHEITNWFDWGDGIVHYGPFRDAISEFILFIAIVLDIYRDLKREKSEIKVARLVKEIKQQSNQ